MARGQDGFASPFLYDSFIHYFTPVYPDAIQAIRLLSFTNSAAARGELRSAAGRRIGCRTGHK